MTVTARRFKTAIVTFTSPVLADFSCQLMAIQPTNNTPDGDKFYTYCADGTGEGREEVDQDWAITLRGKMDWAAAGLNRYLATNDGETVELVVNFDNGVTGFDRTWTGDVVIKMPGDGGDARSPEEFEVTWNYVAKPVLTYAA